MMKSQILTFAAMIALVAFAITLKAEIDAIPTVGFLSHISDDIVVGTATLISTSNAESSIQIQVSRSIKGSIAPKSLIQLTLRNRTPQCEIDPTASPTTAIWFLKSLPSGGFSFAESPKSQLCHPFQNDYIVDDRPLPQEWQYSNDKSGTDKLAYELAAAFYDQRGDGPVSFIVNPNLLHGVSKEAGRNIYEKLSEGQNINVKMVGLLGLIRLADQDRLHYLNENLNTLQTTPRRRSFTKGNKQVEISYSNSSSSTYSGGIANAVAEIRSPEVPVVHELGTLIANSSVVAIRYAAAKALQNIHTALAVQLLAPLLDSDDPMLRAYAIGGLSCLANAVPVIDPDAQDGGFDLTLPGPLKSAATLDHFAFGTMTISKRESYYLSYWKEWWADNRQKIEAQGN